MIFLDSRLLWIWKADGGEWPSGVHNSRYRCAAGEEKHTQCLNLEKGLQRLTESLVDGFQSLQIVIDHEVLRAVDVHVVKVQRYYAVHIQYQSKSGCSFSFIVFVHTSRLSKSWLTNTKSDGVTWPKHS